MDNEHPHKKVISNIDSIASLITILNNSKTAYIKKNLSIHLHSRELALLLDVFKHSKPYHKKAIIKKYQKLEENPELIPENHEIHKNIFIKRYRKLESKGLVKLDENPDNALPYDVELTQKGTDVLEEVTKLEQEWENIILEDCSSDREELIKLLQDITFKALEINYIQEKEALVIY